MSVCEGHKPQLEDAAIARASAYKLLARCFSYPDLQLLDLFSGDIAGECVGLLASLGVDAAGGVARIAEWLDGHVSPDAALVDLQREYTRLFINAYPRTVVPPYSSVYLDTERRVWGASTAQVVRMYEAAEVGVTEDFHDIPDHIAAEMEFGCYLAQQSMGQGQSGQNAPDLASIVIGFLRDHLLRWAPLFLPQVSQLTISQFYREIAEIGFSFLQREAQRVGASIP